MKVQVEEVAAGGMGGGVMGAYTTAVCGRDVALMWP